MKKTVWVAVVFGINCASNAGLLLFLVKRCGHVAHPQNKILETWATVATAHNIQQRMIQKANGIVHTVVTILGLLQFLIEQGNEQVL